MNLVMRKVRNQDLYNVKDVNKDEFVLKGVNKKRAEAYIEKYGKKKRVAAASPVAKKRSPEKKEQGLITRIFGESPKKENKVEVFMNKNKGVAQRYKITHIPEKGCYQVKDLSTNRIMAKCTTLVKAEKQIQILIDKRGNDQEIGNFYSSSRIGDYTFTPTSIQITVQNRRGDTKIETLSLSRMSSSYTIGQASDNIKNKTKNQI